MQKTILVTGASGNLGYAVTQQLVFDGYHVLAVDASDPREDFRKSEKITPVKLDLSSADDVREYLSGVKKDIHAAILTVGGFAMGGFDKTDGEQLRKMWSLNFETAWNMVSELLPVFMDRGEGQFVLIGARPALEAKGGRKMIAYALSKSLVFRLSELINAEAKETTVHSTVIVPSTIDTPANRKSMPDADFSGWVPPERIAETISFLLSETGSMLRESVVKIYHKS